MTIREAIEAVDYLLPNQYTGEDKIQWLSTCDGLIYRDILGPRERGAPPAEPWPSPFATGEDDPLLPVAAEEPEAFTGYSAETDRETALLVPYPYDRDIYLNYLAMSINLANEEPERYNQSRTLYNNALLTYRNDVNRKRSASRPGARFRW